MSPVFKRLFAVAAFAALLAALVAGLLHQTVIWFNMPSRGRFPVWGIDVSHHQRAIDWPAVAGAGVQFAWIKATEGGDHRDTRFAENWAGATDAGVVTGAYHFFTFCRDPAEQAANFLAVHPKVGRALPPAVDVELGGNCAARPADLPARLRVFADAVEAGLGRRPIVYTTSEVLALWPVEGELWMRDIFWEPPGPWVFWQYGYERHLPGVDGLVDVNVYAGSKADFAARVFELGG